MTYLRLKKRSQYLAVSRRGVCYKTPHLIFNICESDEKTGIGYGFTASKKVGNAVKRNKVKRRLKECVRLYLKEHPNNFSLACVIIAKSHCFTAPFATLLEQVSNTLEAYLKTTKEGRL